METLSVTLVVAKGVGDGCCASAGAASAPAMIIVLMTANPVRGMFFLPHLLKALDYANIRPASGNRDAEPRGVEHHVLLQVVVEISPRFHAVAGIVRCAPELLILVGADSPQQRGEAAAEMGHVDGKFGMTVEHAGIDQPDGRHNQRELASHRARRVVAVKLFGLVELQGGMHEYEQPEPFAFGPERLEFRRIEIEAAGLGG